MSDKRTFFHFQERALGGLWAWGLASMAAGLGMLAVPNRALRHAGLQALSWGAIDALLAWLGRRGARRSIARGAADGPRQARRFRAILLANAVLDAGYIAGGLALIRSARGRPERAGMGVGIVPQGLFLLCYDLLLAWLAGPWARELPEDQNV
ncbi:DUF6992 family protein [Kouleothrix sp.]|uniref:DUF6992 family protein n=1 Tax=Kouleothrix sp. TaxID=2779161 RepID=UPI003919F384